MRCTRRLIAAALVSLTTPAAAQLEDSYSDHSAPAPSASSPAPVAPAVPDKPVVRVVYRSMPKRLKYESDGRIPFGYHVSETSGDGLIVAGAVVCGLSGALLGLGLREATNGTNDGEFDGAGVWLGGFGLAVGVPLLLAGLSHTPKKILVRNDARLVVRPVIARNAHGAALAVIF